MKAAGRETTLEETGMRLGEILRRALADRLAGRRADDLPDGATRVDGGSADAGRLAESGQQTQGAASDTRPRDGREGGGR